MCIRQKLERLVINNVVKDVEEIILSYFVRQNIILNFHLLQHFHPFTVGYYTAVKKNERDLHVLTVTLHQDIVK